MLENLSKGVSITIIGIAIVFAVLVALWLLLEGMRIVFYKPDKTSVQKVKVQKQEQAPVIQSVAKIEESVDEGELVAVLTAAIASSLNTSTYNLNIVSYRQVGSNAPAWNAVSRRENLN